jgi:hypothetical protein
MGRNSGGGSGGRGGRTRASRSSKSGGGNRKTSPRPARKMRRTIRDLARKTALSRNEVLTAAISARMTANALRGRGVNSRTANRQAIQRVGRAVIGRKLASTAMQTAVSGARQRRNQLERTRKRDLTRSQRVQLSALRSFNNPIGRQVAREVTFAAIRAATQRGLIM